MAMLTTTKVIETAALPPGHTIHRGQVRSPPLEGLYNGKCPTPAAKPAHVIPMPEMVRTAVITETDTRTGKQTIRHERVVDDLSRVDGEPDADYWTRNDAHRKRVQDEHVRRNEARRVAAKAWADENAKAAKADEEIEAARLEGHAKAMGVARPRNGRVNSADPRMYDDRVKVDPVKAREDQEARDKTRLARDGQ